MSTEINVTSLTPILDQESSLTGKCILIHDSGTGDPARFDASKLATKSRVNDITNGLDNAKANKSGEYDELISGSSKSLIGSNEVVARFTRRSSGGNSDIGTGPAVIRRIKGNAAVWNQLTPISDSTRTNTNNGVTLTDNRDGSYTLSGTATADTQFLGINISPQYLVLGHKYLVRCLLTGVSGAQKGMFWYNPNENSPTLYEDTIFAATSVAAAPYFVPFVSNGQTVSMTVKPQLFDLTLMFGSGYEPSTVAEFRALFPRDYYAYNAGAVIGNKASKLLTNGFNQWDEEWRIGFFQDGRYVEDIITRLCSKNYIRVLPGATYSITIAQGAFVYAYNEDKTYIAELPVPTSATVSSFTTPANAAYIQFSTQTAGHSGYSHDICINLHHSGARDGQYEPYTQSETVLNLSTLTGKVNGQGASSVIFADGMIGRGALYDTIEVVEGQLKMAVRRWGKVDLGSLDWYYSGACFGTVGIKALITPPVSRSTDYGICSRYAWSGWEACADKTYSVDTDGELKITDSAYSDAASIKAALSGVYLYYEMATPVEYTLDTPIDPIYPVDDYGLEWVLQENGSTPTTAPILYDVIYAINAADTIRNIDSKHPNATSLSNLLSALKTAGVIADYTMVWSAATSSYVFTITPNIAS